MTRLTSFIQLRPIALLIGAILLVSHAIVHADTQYAHVVNMAKAGADAAFGSQRVGISISAANAYSDSTLNARFVAIRSSMQQQGNSLNINIKRDSKDVIGIGWGGDDDVVTNIKLQNLSGFPTIHAKKSGKKWVDAADDNPSAIIWTNDRSSMAVFLDDRAYQKPSGWGHNKGYYFKTFAWNPAHTTANLTFDVYLHGDSKKYFTGDKAGQKWHRAKLKAFYNSLNKSKIKDKDWVRGIFFWTLVGNIESFVPLVEIETIDGTAREGTSDNGRIRVTRQDNFDLPLSVYGTWATTPSANNSVAVTVDGDDLSRNFTLKFSKGEKFKDIIIRALQDDLYDPDEKLTVTLTPHDNYKLRSPTASVNLIDNTPLLATIQASKPNAYLPDTPGEFKVDLSAASTVPITVRYNVGGTAPVNVRYRALPGNITFQPGERSHRVLVIPIQNYVVTPTQTVVATLVASSPYQHGSAATATVRIIDNNDNIFSITTTNTKATPKGDPAMFRVVRRGNNLAPITLNWSISGTAKASTHYTPTLPASVAFGEGVREVSFTPNAVSAPPPDRSLTITLTPAPRYTVGNPNTITLTIAARKPVTHVTINAAIVSGASTVENAVDSWVPNGVTVKGGIIALGNGTATKSNMPATVIPQREYLNGTWIPPVVPYGIDIRIKEIKTKAQ